MQTDNQIGTEGVSLEAVGGVFSKYKEEYLSKFRVHTPTSLFPPDFNLLRENKCPICGRKIYITRNKKTAYCKSKVKDGFVIKGQTLLALGGSLR